MAIFFCFFEGDLKEFLEEYMSSNSSCFVLSERHSKEDNHKRYSSTGTVCMYFMILHKKHSPDSIKRHATLPDFESSCLIEVGCFMGFLRNSTRLSTMCTLDIFFDFYQRVNFLVNSRKRVL